MRRWRYLVLAALLAGAGPAAAQDAGAQNSNVQNPNTQPAAPFNGDWGDAPLVVIGHYAGPALWRVKKGNSEVYIVGGLPVMLKRYDWDRARIGNILGKANVLLVAPKARGGLMSFTEWQFSKGNGLFKSLYDVLPSDLGGRFWRIAAKNGLDPKAYAKDSPVYAVMKLRDDVYEKRGLSTNDPEKMLVFMARDHNTPMKPVASYSASDLIGKLNSMNKDQRMACVGATLDEIDFATGHADAATRAWATADLKGARDNSPPSATFACLEGSGKTHAALDRAVQDTVEAVDNALDKPGKSVVVFPLSLLLRPNGALDQLRAEGDDVSVPEM